MTDETKARVLVRCAPWMALGAVMGLFNWLG